MNSTEIVRSAALAPSSHNTQPWIFRVDGDTVELWADRTRALPVNDPHDRELTISCGAALLNARVAAAHSGTGARVSVLPDPEVEPDLLARATLEGEPETGLADPSLFDAIRERRTVRDPFERRVPDPGLVSALTEAAGRHGAWIAEIHDEPRREGVVALVAEGDRRQFADPRWRRELAAWMHPRRKGDGLVMHGMPAPVVRAVVSHFDVGRSTAERDAHLAAMAPLLVVLGTDGDDPENWLAAGEALEHLLLVAAAAGVQASYLNQPCQVTELRPKLAEIVGTGASPQVVLRLGYPTDETPRAPRRPLDDVIERSQSAQVP
jgi:nitroreductase